MRPAANRDILFRDICSQVVTGKLAAFGYRTKPSVEIIITQIPHILFRNPIWQPKSDTIEAAGQRFEQIEIARIARTEAVVTASKARDDECIPRIGRPTKEDEIDNIVKAMLTAGDIPNSRKVFCEVVRQAALRKGLSTQNGYSDSTIKRVIVRAEAELRPLKRR